MFKDALSVILLFSAIQSGSGFVQPSAGTNCKPISCQHRSVTRVQDGSQIAGFGYRWNQKIDSSLHALPFRSAASSSASASASASSGLFGTLNSKERRRMLQLTASSSSNHMRFDTSTEMRMAASDDGDTSDQKKTVLCKAYDATFGRIKNFFVFLLVSILNTSTLGLVSQVV